MKIELRPIKLADASLLLKWRNTPDIYMLGSSRRPVTEIEHMQWMNKLVEDDKSAKFIIMFDHFECGQIRLDYVEDNLFEISMFVLSEFKGNKIGTKAMSLCFEKNMNKNSIVIAKILKENSESLCFFQKNKFIINSENDLDIFLKREF